MQIYVCVKHVPDSAAKITIKDDNRIDESKQASDTQLRSHSRWASFARLTACYLNALQQLRIPAGVSSAGGGGLLRDSTL